MSQTDSDVLTPLLHSPSTPDDGSKSVASSEDAENPADSLEIDRSVEHDVLPETSTLGRNISWQSAYILVISRVIGSGIFATPGTIVKSVGSVGLTLLLWVVGAVIAACGLSISLEYGCMLPRSGGEKVYLEFTYRRPRFLASTLVAVQAVILGFTASNCIVFAQYVLFAFDFKVDDFTQKSLAVGLLTAITIVHGCFLRLGIHIQNVLGWIKVGLVMFIIGTGLFIVIFRSRTASEPQQRSRISDWDALWADSNWSWGIISTALFKVFYSYAGLGNMNNVLNEVKDPVRTLKSVSVSALVTACLMYVLVNLAYFLVIPLEEIKQSGELIAALFFERTFGPEFGKRVLPLAVALSAAGNVMVVTFALGFLPFGRMLSSNKPFNAPMGGLIVHYIPSLLVIALPPSKETYSFILDVEGYPAQFFGLATSIGLLWLRRTRPDLKRPYKSWLSAVWVRIALSIALIAAPFFPSKNADTGGLWYATYAVVGISIILFGIVYWYVWTILIPRWRGYKLEEEFDVLDDGTTVTRLVHVPS